MRAARHAKNLGTASPPCQRSVGHFRFRLFRAAGTVSTFGGVQLTEPTADQESASAALSQVILREPTLLAPVGPDGSVSYPSSIAAVVSTNGPPFSSSITTSSMASPPFPPLVTVITNSSAAPSAAASEVQVPLTNARSSALR